MPSLKQIMSRAVRLLLAASAAGSLGHEPARGELPPRGARLPGDPARAAPFAPSLLPAAAGSPVDCVILAPDSLADVYQRLADHQTRTGRPTVVRTLGTVRAADPRSSDLAQAVRAFLRSARDLWGTRWAVLAGDHDAIPLRTVRVLFAQTLDIPTDVYYADLDGTWDENANGIYGEVADSLDMEPDIAVGRLPARTRADAQAVVAKALRYATSPAQPALGKQLILAEVLFPSDWQPGDIPQVDGAVAGESLRVHAPACAAVDRLYENLSGRPGASPLNEASALAALSRGYNLVYHVGHGARSQLSVGPDMLTVSELAGIANGDSAAIWISSNCASAAVDFDCVAERLVRRADGGALAYIGATRDEWPGPSARLNVAIQDRLFGTAGSTLGESVENARAVLFPQARTETQERWAYFETILLGLPSLPVWRCPPATLTVSRPASVPLGSAGFTVGVQSGGAPVESALVAVWKEAEDYRAVLTNAAGEAFLPFRPGSTGGFSLAVSAPDALPVLDSLTVTAAAPAHFALVGASTSDAAHGNGDGLAGAGEAFGIAGVLRNTGQTASAGTVTIEVQAETSGLAIESGAATIAALGAGAEAALPGSLRIRALPEPHRDRLERIRVIARDASRADTSRLDVVVSAASLLLSSSTFADAGGNGSLDAGEDASLSWTIANEGSGRAAGLALRATNPAVGIVLLDSTATVPDIPPGGAAPGSSVSFHASAVPAGRLFDLEAEDAYGHRWIFPIERGAPGVPAGLRVVASGTGGITLAWSAVPSPDLLGYVILRAGSDTTAAPVEVTTVPARRSPSYENAGLAPLTRYHYAALAVDSSGNRSARSPWLLASTSPPALAGWPAPLQASTSSSVCLTDLDGDDRLEIVVGADLLYVFRHDGTDWIDGDGVPSTVGVFSTLLHHVPSAPAAADIDLDGVPEIVAASWNDSLVAVFEADGSLLPGWPRKGAAPFWSAPSIGDLSGDGLPDVVVGSNASRIYAWHATGNEIVDGDGDPATDGVFHVPSGNVISSPAIADLNRDGIREVIVGTSAARVLALTAAGPLPGWPFTASGTMSSSPAVGDILPGGGLEVAIASGNDSVYVLTADGRRAPGWPRRLELTPGNGRVNSPALAPLRRHLGDPGLYVIVCGTDGSLRAYDASGAVAPGWESLTLGGGTESTPAVADLDGDGSLEVVIGAEDRRIYAFHADGTPVNGFPIEIGAEARATPAIWDVDGNGGVDLVIAGWDGRVHAWSYPGSFSTAGMAWPMFRHDNWHTGVATFPILTSAEPPPSPPGAPPAAATLDQNRPNPFNPVTVIGFTVPAGGPAPVALRVYSVDGRLVRTLVSRRLDPGYHEVRWDGRGDRGEPLGSGVYFYRAEIGSAALARKMALLR